jgi:hypothetical protein
MAKYKTDPGLLDELDAEVSYGENLRSKTSTWMKMLKVDDYLNDEGDSITFRILPAQFTSKKTWFVRYAQHWVSSRPKMCVTHTNPELGGNPDFECPMCQVYEKYHASGTEAQQNAVWKMGSDIRYYVAVIPISSYVASNQRHTAFKDSEKVPHRLDIRNNQFREIVMINRNYIAKKPKSGGIIDPYSGCDLTFTKLKARGKISIVKEDAAMVYGETEAEAEAFLDEIWPMIKNFDMEVPDNNTLDEIVDDMEAQISKLGNARPPRGATSIPPRTRGRSTEEHSIDDDDLPMDEPPRRTSLPPARAAAPARQAAPPARRAPEPEPVHEDEGHGADEQEYTEQSNQEPEPPPAPVRSAAPARVAPTAPPASAPRSRLIPARVAPTNAVPPRVGADEDGEDDGVAPERHDPAPVSNAPVDSEIIEDNTPPPVKAVGSNLRPDLQARLAKSISRTIAPTQG